MSKKPGSGGAPGDGDPGSEEERETRYPSSLDDLDLESLLLEDAPQHAPEEEDLPRRPAANGKGHIASASSPLIIDDGELDLLDAGSAPGQLSGQALPAAGVAGGDGPPADLQGGALEKDGKFEDFLETLYEAPEEPFLPPASAPPAAAAPSAATPLEGAGGEPADAGSIAADAEPLAGSGPALGAGGAEPAGRLARRVKGGKKVARATAKNEDRAPVEMNARQEKERDMSQSSKKPKAAKVGPGKKIGRKASAAESSRGSAAKERPVRSPAKTGARGTVAFICSECYEEFLIPASYSSETLSCPECLHVGKRSDDNFILKVLTHKSGERNSALLAAIAGLVLVGLLATLLIKLSPFTLAEGTRPDENTPLLLLVGSGVMAVIFLFLVWRAEKNRWEAYF